MKSFGFTHKKFTRLTAQGRHRHTADWLAQIFQSLRTKRVSKAQWKAFLQTYTTVLDWMSQPLHSPLPQDPDLPDQLAWVSDALLVHRRGSGLVIQDHHLSETMITGDRNAPLIQLPEMEYQVALDGLRSLFNIGAIFRTCETAGVKTILLGSCPGTEDPRVRKTAMGAHEGISEERTFDLAGLLAEKKARGFTIIGVETVKGSLPCHQFDWPKKAVLVFGNEEYGIAPHIMPMADRFVHIPMLGKKNSLNVSNAVSAVLFQAVFSFMP